MLITVIYSWDTTFQFNQVMFSASPEKDDLEQNVNAALDAVTVPIETMTKSVFLYFVAVNVARFTTRSGRFMDACCSKVLNGAQAA